MNVEEKLQHFQAAALQDASEKSANALAQYRRILQEAYDKHTQDKTRQANALVRAEARGLISKNNTNFSAEFLKIKKTAGETMDTLIDSIFSEVEEMLTAFIRTPAYTELLIRQIRQALDFAGGEEIIIYLSPSDSELLKALQENTGAAVQLAEESYLGGIKAFIPARSIIIDESFRTRLAEEKEEFTFDGGDIHV